MIIAFLGKGGSGKSSLSTQMALFLKELGKSVLAIDADHNMDLSYNLSSGEIPQINYFSQSLGDFQSAISLPSDKKYSDAFLLDIAVRFFLSPSLSKEIEMYSSLLKNDIRVMIAGPQTDTVLYGQSCSHSLTTPLKILLPLLELKDHEFVVIDEKAGADGVSTGIITGADVGVIVCEPSIHSTKTALQISQLMKFYGTPYIFVGNKVSSVEDEEFIKAQLGQSPIVFFSEDSSIKRTPYERMDTWNTSLQNVLDKALLLNQNNRLLRTIQKFQRNHTFSS